MAGGRPTNAEVRAREQVAAAETLVTDARARARSADDLAALAEKAARESLKGDVTSPDFIERMNEATAAHRAAREEARLANTHLAAMNAVAAAKTKQLAMIENKALRERIKGRLGGKRMDAVKVLAKAIEEACDAFNVVVKCNESIFDAWPDAPRHRGLLLGLEELHLAARNEIFKRNPDASGVNADQVAKVSFPGGEPWRELMVGRRLSDGVSLQMALPGMVQLFEDGNKFAADLLDGVRDMAGNPGPGANPPTDELPALPGEDDPAPPSDAENSSTPLVDPLAHLDEPSVSPSSSTFSVGGQAYQSSVTDGPLTDAERAELDKPGTPTTVATEHAIRIAENKARRAQYKDQPTDKE